jgi:hypothetical protein
MFHVTIHQPRIRRLQGMQMVLINSHDENIFGETLLVSATKLLTRLRNKASTPLITVNSIAEKLRMTLRGVLVAGNSLKVSAYSPERDRGGCPVWDTTRTVEFSV